jgi:class 3 adenylate cyclase
MTRLPSIGWCAAFPTVSPDRSRQALYDLAAVWALSMWAMIACSSDGKFGFMAGAEFGRPVFDRIGIHVGAVWIEDHEGAGKAQDLYGLQVDTCARVQSLGQAAQILI